MNIESYIFYIGQIIWGWPLILAFGGVGLFATLMLNFVQFRYLIKSFKLVLFPDKAEVEKGRGTLTPFQAFINTLGTSTGNGSIAGMATAVYAGGPGAAFWVLVSGVFALALRFAEVYLGTFVKGKYTFNGAKAGPMVYLSLIPGGSFLPYVFMAFMLLYGLSSGNAMQANSIGLGIHSTWGISPLITAFCLIGFLGYVILGGAQRVLKISDKLVPFKVGVFFLASFIVLGYHYASLIPAIILIFKSAFSIKALGGAATGITIQAAIRNGMARSLNAHEGGLGVAPVFFGETDVKNPVETSILSMVSAFISTYLVCFIVALSVIASGVWNNGLSSTALTVSAFNTVFGNYGGWVVTFCSASFGLGVLVAFSLVAKESWSFLTGGRWLWLFSIVYCVVAFFGTLAKVDLIWSVNDIVNGLMLLINLYAIAWMMPTIRKGVLEYNKKY
jgi:alanine or glycine:cation symporter, AGCS family